MDRPPRVHVALDVTARCNQRCIFCLEGEREGRREPSLREVERLLDEARTRADRVVFRGGEALRRPDILPIVRYGAGLGLEVSAFTNGQVLAREDFVTELAFAGLTELQVSFHHPDAETFARVTRTWPRDFERLLRGLAEVAEHNRRHPERPVTVTPEIALSSLNLGRLAELDRLLGETLGDSYRAVRLAGLVPTPTDPPWNGPALLEPMAARRAELAEFLPSLPPGREVSFTRLALCLVPGWEHCSLDATVGALGQRVPRSVAEEAAVADGQDGHGLLADHPFRWVCQECDLLALCPHRRTRRGSRLYAPRPDQEPIPFERPRLEAVLERIFAGSSPESALPESALDGPVEHGDPRARAATTAARLRAAAAAHRSPEAEVVRALRARSDGDWRVRRAVSLPQGRLDVTVETEGQAVRLTLEPPTPLALGRWLVGGFAVALTGEDDAEGPAATGGASPAALPTARAVAAALRPLATLTWPPAGPGGESREGRAGLVGGAELHDAVQAVTRRLGERLWPTVGHVGPFRTEGAHVARDGGVNVLLSHPGTAPFELTVRRAGAPVDASGGAPALLAWSDELRVALRPAAEAPRGALLGALLADVRAALGAPRVPVRWLPPVVGAGVGGRPVAAAGAGAGAAEARHFQARPDTLWAVLAERGAPGPPLVAFLGRARPGDALLLREGELGLSIHPHPERAAVAALVRVVRAASHLVSAAPDGTNGETWRAALAACYAHSPLAARFGLLLGTIRDGAQAAPDRAALAAVRAGAAAGRRPAPRLFA